MKKYKYIGTEKQLVEFGFNVISLTNPNCKGAYKVVDDKETELYIPLFNSIYGERVIQYAPFGDDSEVFGEHIQDLIDAKLVEEIEE